jgi:hypothetical protein
MFHFGLAASRSRSLSTPLCNAGRLFHRLTRRSSLSAAEADSIKGVDLICDSRFAVQASSSFPRQRQHQMITLLKISRKSPVINHAVERKKLLRARWLKVQPFYACQQGALKQ